MTPLRLGTLAAFCLALLVRVVYLQEAWQRNELIDFGIIDARVYLDWAREILAGNLLWAQSSNYTPVYPLYLASWLQLLSERTCWIFLAFHSIGAVQAVLIGSIAKQVWGWREAVVASLLAATYWPFVVFEASFYAEPFALWTASLGLLLLVRSARSRSSLGLLGAGLFLGLAGLARANLLLCVAACCVWLALERLRTLRRGPDARPHSTGLRRVLAAARPACVFALPVVLLSAPIVAWNLQVTDRPILRSQAGLTLFLGNNPDFGGLVVRPGIRWTDLTIEPQRAGKTSSREKEEYWQARTLALIADRPAAWLALQWKKLSMHLGAFEVSQEIDVSRYRRASPVLSLPVWPGFGLVMPLAMGGIAVVLWRRERAALPLLVFALTYAASLLPFQAAARYRLPLLLALIPLAAHLLVWAFQRAREWKDAGAGRGGGRAWKEALAVGLVLAVGFVLVVPDHTDLRSRNQVEHEHYVALKHYRRGDPERALLGFAEAAALRQDDPDSPFWLGRMYLECGELALAREAFLESRKRYRPNPESLLGLAQVAMAVADYDAAREAVALATEEWPYSQPGLRLLKEIALRQQDWQTVRDVLDQLRTFSSVTAAELFELGFVAERVGDYETVLSVHQQIAGNELYAAQDRSRALFVSGVAAWRRSRDVAAASEAWRPLSGRVDLLFGALASYLLGDLDEAGLALQVSGEGPGGQFVKYSRGLAAWMRGDVGAARVAFREIVDQRGADSLPLALQTVPESWALADLGEL